MVVEIHGYELQIVLDEAAEGIIIHRTGSDKLYVTAHPQLPQQELLVYLRKNIPSYKKAKSKEVSDCRTDIHIFDRKHYIQSSPRARTPYILANTVYTNRVPQNPKQEAKLKKQLLQSHIMREIGLWEDRLAMLTENIVVKNLPRRLFHIDPNNKRLVYSQKLSEKSSKFVNYIVATTVLDYFDVSETRSHQMLNKHIPDWRHFDRVYRYENSTE